MSIKFANPTNDVAFKKMFTEDNLDALKDFIKSIISNAKDFPFLQDLNTIEFLEKEQLPIVIKGKRSLCDLKVTDSKGNIYIIEMQKRNEEDYLERVQYYSAHSISQRLAQGDDHILITPVITISIMGKNCFNDNVPCISYHPHIETHTGKQYLKMLSHIFVEIPKLDNAHFDENTTEWLEVFRKAPTLTEMPEVHNAYISGIYTRLEQHGWSKDEMDAYVEAKIFDDMEKGNIRHAEARGEARGVEIGEARGEARGREEGIEIGEARGKEEAIENTAINMLKEDADIKFISTVTGFSKDQILKLKNKI